MIQESIFCFTHDARTPGALREMSNYALTFVFYGDRLRARTHAAFPGILGRLYRAAVIGSGGHRLMTRRLLRQVARAT